MDEIINRIVRHDVDLAIRECRSNDLSTARKNIKDKTGTLLTIKNVAYIYQKIYADGNATRSSSFVTRSICDCKHDESNAKDILSSFKKNADKQLSDYIYKHFMRTKRYE